MVRLIVGGFLIAHGLLHPSIYAAKDEKEPMPFDPNRSWALTAAHVDERPTQNLSIALAWLTALVFTVAGVLVFADVSLWTSIAIAGAALGLILKGLYFTPWLIAGVAIDVGIIWAALANWPPSLT
jgi:hypothetical protein